MLAIAIPQRNLAYTQPLVIATGLTESSRRRRKGRCGACRERCKRRGGLGRRRKESQNILQQSLHGAYFAYEWAVEVVS